MDYKSFYSIETCPYCNKYALCEVGYNKLGNKIVKCRNCNEVMLVKDIDKIRKEQDENSKMGK